MKDYDYFILKHMLLTNPRYVCISLVTKELMKSLIILQLGGIIEHLFFCDCDCVEGYIEIIWKEELEELKLAKKLRDFEVDIVKLKEN